MALQKKHERNGTVRWIGRSSSDPTTSADRGANLSERAYQLIRSEILFYQLPPGCRVSEASLTARFGLRQAAVRSALLRLMQEGLIDRTDERSPRVAPLTLKDVRDIYGLRALVEPHAAALAAETGVAADGIERLREISCSHYELRNHQEFVTFLRANREFNIRVAGASGNARLVEAIAHLQDLTLRVLYVGIRSLDVSDWFKEIHLQIVNAIETGNGARASELWTTDLRYGERLICDALLHLPELSEVNLASASVAPPPVASKRIHPRQ
jgi:DNA-binding GntR family transcriptional regulator